MSIKNIIKKFQEILKFVCYTKLKVVGMKKKILIDVDDCLCENNFIDEINAFLGTCYKTEDLSQFYIDYVIGSEKKKKEFYNIVKDKNLYEHARIFEGAVETLKNLNKIYDVYICSACIWRRMEKDKGKKYQYTYYTATGKKKTTENEFLQTRIIPVLEKEEKAKIKNFQKIYGRKIK